MDKTSILRRKYREDKDRTEWALLSKDGKRVLRWFGQEKPSEERVKKEESRVQMFKHLKGKRKSSIDTVKIASRIAGYKGTIVFETADDDGSTQYRVLRASNDAIFVEIYAGDEWDSIADRDLEVSILESAVADLSKKLGL